MIEATSLIGLKFCLFVCFQALLDLQMNSDLKAQLHDLTITGAKVHHRDLFITERYLAGMYEDIIMVALCNRADHYIFALWFYLSSFFFFLA